MSSASQAAFSQFPPTLDTIPEELRLTESFGWTPAVLGLAGVLGGAAILIVNRSAVSDYLLGSGILILLGGLFLYWEYWRRQNRTVLVPQGSAIGVYRKGAFDLAVAPGQISYYQLSWFNTARYLIIPGAGLVGVTSGMEDSGKPHDAATWMAVVALGAVCLALGGLVVHTRIMLRHFYVPRQKGRRERIMLTREAAARIYKS